MTRAMVFAGPCLAPARVVGRAWLDDQAHLNRRFRRFQGTTPAAYA